MSSGKHFIAGRLRQKDWESGEDIHLRALHATEGVPFGRIVLWVSARGTYAPSRKSYFGGKGGTFAIGAGQGRKGRR